MKNVFNSKFHVVILFLLYSVSLSAIEVPGAFMANWINHMEGGHEEDLVSGVTYVFLDEFNKVNVQLSVITTDDNLSLYDELYLSYDFGGIYTDYILVEEADLVPFEPGSSDLFKATYNLRLNFSAECLNDTDGIMPILINLGLKVEKQPGEYDDYSFQTNEGLFDPNFYVNLVSQINIDDKVLLCWGTSPPPSMVGNEDANTLSSDKLDTNSNLEYPDLDAVTQNVQNFENLSVFPNPFNQTFQLAFHLDQSSDLEIQMVNLTGQRVFYQKYLSQPAGKFVESFNFEEDLAPGIYTIQVYYLGQTNVVRLVKLKTSK